MSRKLTNAAIQLLWLLLACDSGGFDSHRVRAPTKLAFTVQPTAAMAGAAISPAVALAVQDADGNTVVNGSPSIAVAISSNPAGGTLSGTATVTAVNGVATFSNLSLDKSGTGYTLTAGATGLTGAISSPFEVTPAVATKLAFGVQPTTTAVGYTIAPAVQVVIQDAQGNTATSASPSVTVAIGTNPAGATLLGTATVAAASGVATFSNLSLDRFGTGYKLTADAAGLTGATSSPFDVTDPVDTVSITPAYVNARAGDQVGLTATTLNSAGNVLTGRTVTWSTSDWRVVYLLWDGVVCGLASGSATITATSEGKSGTALVTVSGGSSIACCYAGC
jgi:hypothetical protein